MTTIKETVFDDQGNITVIKGDDLVIDVTIKDGDGDPINITNGTIYMTVKVNSTDADSEAKIAKVVTTHTTPLSGQSQIAITNAENEQPAGNYRYDIRFKDSGNKVLTYIRNRKYIIKENITDET